MCKVMYYLLILFFSGRGLADSISEGNNVTLQLKAILNVKNDTNTSNVLINIKEIKSGRRDLDYSDNKESTPSKLLDFTNFLKQAISILRSYDDKDLEDIFAVIDEEVRKYRYNGRGIKTWARSSDTLKHILKKLEIMKDMPGKNMRRNLNQIILALQGNNFGKNVTQLIDFIDSLYKNDSAFLSVINDLNLYKYQSKRSNIYLSDLVKRSLQSLVFDTYKNMERKNKNELNLKMELFLRKLPIHNDVRTTKQEQGRDETAANLELQFVPELKVQEIHSAVDRLKEDQYRRPSRWKTTATQMTEVTNSSSISKNISPEVDDDCDNPQKHLKHISRQGFQNINIETSDISKNEDLLNFILSLIGSIGDSNVQTSTTESSAQSNMLISFIKYLVKSFPSKKSKADSEDRILNPKSRSKQDSKHEQGQHESLNLNIEFVGLPKPKKQRIISHQDKVRISKELIDSGNLHSHEFD